MSDQPKNPNKASKPLQNGRRSEEIVEVPKVIIEDSEDSSGFASSVVKVLSMQRFYTKSVRKSRESWLQKYAYHRANDEREWRRPLMRKSPSPSPQPESPCNDQNATEFCHDEEHDSNENTADYQRECCMPFVLEPSGKLYFWWLVIVSLGVMYNYCAIILYVAFSSLYTQNTKVCFGIDYAFDSIFVLDIILQFRTGFLQHGILERRSHKLAANYMTSVGFLLDMLAVIPFDLLYFIIGLYPILRVNRLLKVRRFFLFCDRGEIYSGRPKLFNLLKLILYLVLIIHWVACFYFMLSRFEGFGQDEWIHPKLEGQWSEVGMQYLYSLHRSSVIMTTVGTITIPRTNLTMIFGCVTYLCGVLIFATIVGNAGDMIVDMRRHREHYLRKLTGMKTYVSAHQIQAQLTRRVIQWYDYLWTQKRDMDEDQLFAKLNDNFRAEIAIHVNLETLIKVEMFKVCDPGFLHDLVLKLKPMICSPGDFICKEGEKGREMFIVNKGRVEVLDEKENILATLKAGSHFGEISLLNMKGIGDRRTASVRSVGFTDLFCLSKDDLEEVLEFYPDEKTHMERIATKTYERQQKERKLAKQMEEERMSGDSEIPKDPREWLAADTATLRRRLSYISSINNLRRFASRVKKSESSDDHSAKNILKEYSEKARKQRSDEECRHMIQEFVAEIRTRDSPSHKPSIESEDSFFQSSPSSSRLISKQLSERLKSKRKKTKRLSFSLAEETTTMSGQCSTIFRQRSHTLGPAGNTRGLLNCQSLETTSQKPAMHYGSFDVKVKSILKKKSSFGETKPNEQPVKKENKQNKSFVVSKEPLVPMRFKDIAKITMEKRRKWFEGEEVHVNTQTPGQNKICLDTSANQSNNDHKDDTVTCSCEAEHLISSSDNILSSSSNSKPVWERQKDDIKHFKRKRKDEEKAHKPKPESVVISNHNSAGELEANAKITDINSNESQVIANHKETRPTQNEDLVASVHLGVECACSKATRFTLPLAHKNDLSKISEDRDEMDSSVKIGNKKESQIEETCC